MPLWWWIVLYICGVGGAILLSMHWMESRDAGVRSDGRKIGRLCLVWPLIILLIVKWTVSDFFRGMNRDD